MMIIKDNRNYTCLDTMIFSGGNVLDCYENKVKMQKKIVVLKYLYFLMQI